MDESDIKQAAGKINAVAYMQKPASNKDLLELVKKYIS